jgi:hypothetical protein
MDHDVPTGLSMSFIVREYLVEGIAEKTVDRVTLREVRSETGKKGFFTRFGVGFAFFGPCEIPHRVHGGVSGGNLSADKDPKTPKMTRQQRTAGYLNCSVAMREQAVLRPDSNTCFPRFPT